MLARSLSPDGNSSCSARFTDRQNALSRMARSRNDPKGQCAAERIQTHFQPSHRWTVDSLQAEASAGPRFTPAVSHCLHGNSLDGCGTRPLGRIRPGAVLLSLDGRYLSRSDEIVHDARAPGVRRCVRGRNIPAGLFLPYDVARWTILHPARYQTEAAARHRAWPWCELVRRAETSVPRIEFRALVRRVKL